MKIDANFLVCFILKFVSPVPLSRPPPACTALVEQFFHAVFAQSPHAPPACVCVRMCGHLTYCYPTGCFTRPEKREVSRIHEAFLVEGDVESVVTAHTVAVDTIEQGHHSNLIKRPNPFKEIVFKYKRAPKLQMKYNLREQVKHTREKKMNVDVSKTRWPINKQLSRNPYKVNHRRSSHYFTSVSPETNQPETSKYFKRYLTKRENQNGLDIGTLYLYKDALNFSLETLIDNLIERGLESVNSTLGLKINTSSESNDRYNKDYSKLMTSVTTDKTIEESVTSSNSTEFPNQSHHNNEIINNISKANENDKTLKDFYIVSNNTTSTYFEMITTLSHEIDQQNKASIEKVEQLTGNKLENLPIENITDSNLLEFVNRTKNAASDYKTSIKVPDGRKSSRNEVFSSLHKEFIPVINGQVKKSKQRVVRKIRNRKVNK